MKDYSQISAPLTKTKVKKVYPFSIVTSYSVCLVRYHFITENHMCLVWKTSKVVIFFFSSSILLHLVDFIDCGRYFVHSDCILDDTSPMFQLWQKRHGIHYSCLPTHPFRHDQYASAALLQAFVSRSLYFRAGLLPKAVHIVEVFLLVYCSSHSCLKERELVLQEWRCFRKMLFYHNKFWCQRQFGILIGMNNILDLINSLSNLEQKIQLGICMSVSERWQCSRGWKGFLQETELWCKLFASLQRKQIFPLNNQHN